MDKVIEIECLQGVEGSYVVKEIAIMSVTEPGLFTKTFKPPYSWRRLPRKVHEQNSWVSRNMTHIRWDEGEVPYANLVPFIRECASVTDRLYTKGTEKADFLSRLLDQDIFELGELGCPRAKALVFPNQRARCCHLNLSRLHRFSWNCAIIKCHIFLEWVRTHLPFVLHDVDMRESIDTVQ